VLDIYIGGDANPGIHFEANSWATPGYSYIGTCLAVDAVVNPGSYSLYVNGDTYITGPLTSACCIYGSNLCVSCTICAGSWICSLNDICAQYIMCAGQQPMARLVATCSMYCWNFSGWCSVAYLCHCDAYGSQPYRGFGTGTCSAGTLRYLIVCRSGYYQINATVGFGCTTACGAYGVGVWVENGSGTCCQVMVNQTYPVVTNGYIMASISDIVYLACGCKVWLMHEDYNPRWITGADSGLAGSFSTYMSIYKLP
jgi:hypothetical protein